MNYYGFTQLDITKHIVLRQWEITLNNAKSLQWIFVNLFSSKPLMPDILPFMQAGYDGNVFAVSKRIKLVFDKFYLPSHTWTPIQVYHDDPVRKRYAIHTPSEYFILSMNPQNYLDIFDFEKSDYTMRDKISDKVSFEELLFSYGERPIIKKFVLNANYDVIYLPYLNFVFNEDMKTAFEKCHLVATDIRNHYAYDIGAILNNIYMVGAEKEAHREKNRLTIAAIDPNKIKRSAKEIKIYKLIETEEAKRDRLLQLPNLVKEYYEKQPAKTYTERELAIRKKEIELNIIFPKKFRKKLVLNKQTQKYDEFFNAIPLEEMVSLGTPPFDRQEYNPYAVKAIGIATDGCLCFYGFILKKTSDIELDDKLYKFETEGISVYVKLQ
jgi:hypothetical protein